MAEDKQVLIVARTRMYGGRVCIGALSDDGENLRLLSASCGYEASNYQIGEMWDISFNRCQTRPPHFEDIAVVSRTRVGIEPDPRAFILARVQPVTGSIVSLFDGFIRFTGTGSGYISENTGIPASATGFWLPNAALHLENVPRGQLYGHQNDYRHLKYVGFQNPIAEIPSGELVRVSLAKWWRPRDADDSLEERCYAQLSGWFLE